MLHSNCLKQNEKKKKIKITDLEIFYYNKIYVNKLTQSLFRSGFLFSLFIKLKVADINNYSLLRFKWQTFFLKLNACHRILEL